MASNILVEKAKEQNIQILQFQNQKLSEQLANLKQQISVLDGSVTKHEEERKRYMDTMLCVNRIWEQLNMDVQSLCKRCDGSNGIVPAPAPAAAATGDPPDASEDAAAGGSAAATAEPAASAAPAPADSADDGNDAACDPWSRFDPFLRRLISSSDAGGLKAIKRNAQDYQADLSEVEQALHARSAASLQALSRLLDLIQQKSAGAGMHQEQLRQLAADDALKQSNEQLQQQVLELQQQLDAAQALQRTTQQLLKQCEDRSFEATENLKSIKNDLADKEYALQAAQRKLQRLKQQQGPAAGDQGSLPMLGGGPRQSSPGVSLAGQASGGGSAGAGPSAGPVARANSFGGSAGGAGQQEDQSAVEELQAQISELQSLLAQRTAEREAEAAALSRTQKELVEARARAGDESWVPQSGLYQLAQKQLAEAAQQLEARAKAVAALQHERDELMRHFENKNTQLEVEKVLRSKVVHLQQQVDELNAKQVELLAQKQQMQLVHQQELSRYGNSKTVSELQSMLSALQKQVDSSTNHARKAAEASAAADSARQEAQATRGELAAAQAQVKLLQERLSAKARELSGLGEREQELKEQVIDLGAFVEVLVALVPGDTGDLELRRSEASLKATVAELREQLNGSELQQRLAAVSASEAQLRQEAEVAAAELAGLQGQVSGMQQQVAGLQREMSKKQAEAEAFAQEIGEAYNAFEEQRQQNSVLLEQLGERDAAAAAAQTERLKLEHELQQMNEQLSAAHMELGSLRGELSQMMALKEAADKDCARISAELAVCREHLLAHSASIDQLKGDLKAREDEKAAAELLLDKERSASAARMRAADEEAAALAEERAKRQKLEDEGKLLTGKLERLVKNANTSEAVQELEEEINALRRLLKCNVCHTRQKDVIITKCWHMFCKPCINKNLEARHRKCPGCGHPFGAADVKQFFFT